MSDPYVALESAIRGPLSNEVGLSSERIRKLIGQFRVAPIFNVSDDEAEMLARQLESQLDITMAYGSTLTDREYEPWLEGVQARIDPYYWARYRKLLVENKFPSQVLASMDSVTSRILGLLENPRIEGTWDRRGLVVGHVQSGKTANYTGLICKAADAGYRVVIVIAGIHNNLRNQTQIRIDEGFVGRDSARLFSNKEKRNVGVGLFDNARIPVTFTNSNKDFNKQTATSVGLPLQNLTEPAVFVIKKNSSTLQNLLEWLQQHSGTGGGKKVAAPLLLIDDEADNASINVKHGKAEASKINAQIRKLLKLFDRSCYVGYTATPFANIFIDPDTIDEMLGDDLFPRHFIVSLDPPTNYFGPNRVFMEESDTFVKNIDDNEDLIPLRHKIDWTIKSLPSSLEDAIRAFVLARSIRLLRGHVAPHCSMLINASRFTRVQRQIRNEVHHKLADIEASVRMFGALSPENALKYEEIRELYRVFDEQYPDAGIDWQQVQAILLEAVAPIKVIEVNSGSSGALNYSDHDKTGLNVIAVGGYSLSRGLTLEGLMISYFLRNSVMYDTLMQMGRWFGYRDGYEDLCRVWMPDEAAGWYAHIAESIEMLRDEIRAMEAAGATPEEFGLRVRAHPSTLIVTARNKMGSGERVTASIGLGNNFIETATLFKDRESQEINRQAVINLSERLSDAGFSLTNVKPHSGSYLLQNAPVGPIIEFLSEFKNNPLSMLTATEPVQRYIEDRSETELKEWDILFAGVERSDANTLVDTSLRVPIRCQRRSEGEASKDDSKTLRITNKQRVASRGVEKIGLSTEEIELAEQWYRDDPHNQARIQSNGSKFNYPDRAYRRVRTKPLLVVHLLAIGPELVDQERVDFSADLPVVAWSISFPQTQNPEKRVDYIVSTVWLRENFRDELDEEEMGGDE